MCTLYQYMVAGPMGGCGVGPCILCLLRLPVGGIMNKAELSGKGICFEREEMGSEWSRCGSKGEGERGGRGKGKRMEG